MFQSCMTNALLYYGLSSQTTVRNMYIRTVSPLPRLLPIEFHHLSDDTGLAVLHLIIDLWDLALHRLLRHGPSYFWVYSVMGKGSKNNVRKSVLRDGGVWYQIVPSFLLILVYDPDESSLRQHAMDEVSTQYSTTTTIITTSRRGDTTYIVVRKASVWMKLTALPVPLQDDTCIFDTVYQCNKTNKILSKEYNIVQ